MGKILIKDSVLPWFYVGLLDTHTHTHKKKDLKEKKNSILKMINRLFLLCYATFKEFLENDK